MLNARNNKLVCIIQYSRMMDDRPEQLVHEQRNVVFAFRLEVAHVMMVAHFSQRHGQQDRGFA